MTWKIQHFFWMTQKGPKIWVSHTIRGSKKSDFRLRCEKKNVLLSHEALSPPFFFGLNQAMGGETSFQMMWNLFIFFTSCHVVKKHGSGKIFCIFLSFFENLGRKKKKIKIFRIFVFFFQDLSRSLRSLKNPGKKRKKKEKKRKKDEKDLENLFFLKKKIKKIFGILKNIFGKKKKKILKIFFFFFKDFSRSRDFS